VSVLILAAELDPSADQMVRALNDRGAHVHRIDTAWFPSQVDLEARLRNGRWEGILRSPHGTIALEDIESVWYRSPTAFRFPSGLIAAEKQHARVEAKLGFGGVLLTLPARWVNRPDLAVTACYKPMQLTSASHAGLTVADTLIANTAEAVSSFVTTHNIEADGVVTKMFGANSIVEHRQRHVAFTRAVTRRDTADLTGIQTTAHLFQANIPKGYDVRVVVIGEHLFGFAIHALTEASRQDFRRDYRALRYERIDIPEYVANGIGKMMNLLGLLYAAIDFVVDVEGCWVFIGDINPGGQYGWLEDATGAPLTTSLADLLTHQDTHQ
jgi:ATP-grasp ribosomal peptide maturase